MLSIKSIITVLCLALAAESYLVSPAKALPVSADLLSAGDGLITRDADSGLDWLDLTVTINASFDNINNGTATFAALGNLNPVIDFGFRYATTAEVTQLFTNGGMTFQDGGNRLADFAAAQLLVGLLGETISTASPYILSAGIADAGSGLRSPYVRYNPSSLTGAAFLGNIPGPTTEGEFFGSYLVRSSLATIPEPGMIPLMGLCLAALAFARSKPAR